MWSAMSLWFDFHFPNASNIIDYLFVCLLVLCLPSLLPRSSSGCFSSQYTSSSQAFLPLPQAQTWHLLPKAAAPHSSPTTSPPPSDQADRLSAVPWQAHVTDCISRDGHSNVSRPKCSSRERGGIWSPPLELGGTLWQPWIRRCSINDACNFWG